jgi:hypothetical protein
MPKKQKAGAAQVINLLAVRANLSTKQQKSTSNLSDAGRERTFNNKIVQPNILLKSFEIAI